MFDRLRDIFARLFDRGVCPYQFSFLLANPFRYLILSPAALVERLELSGGDDVLELGPGPGFYSPAVAERLPRGYLTLVDIQPEMLVKARRRLEDEGCGGYGQVVASGTQLPIQRESQDVAFLVAVLGEVSDQEACLHELYRVLRPEGLLSITEQPGDPDHVSGDKVTALAEAAGFRLVKGYSRGKNYTLSFRRG